MSIGTLGTNFSEILIEILTFSFKKMCSKKSSAKWQPFCLGLNDLRPGTPVLEVIFNKYLSFLLETVSYYLVFNNSELKNGYDCEKFGGKIFDKVTFVEPDFCISSCKHTRFCIVIKGGNIYQTEKYIDDEKAYLLKIKLTPLMEIYLTIWVNY